MNKLTKIILLNALLLACTTASANIATAGDETESSDNLDKKIRAGQTINFQRMLSAKDNENESSRFESTLLQTGEKSRLFKKLPDHLVAANP